MPKWLRKSLTVLLVLAPILLCVVAFGTQTFLAIYFRRMGRKIPILNSVPSDLTNSDVSRASGELLAFRGAQFEVPWRDLNQDKTRVVGAMAAIAFRADTGIVVSVEPQDGLIQDFKRGDTTNRLPQVVSMIAGPDALSSDYAFDQAIFEATPGQITPFTPRYRAGALASVLTAKAIMPPTTDSAIFRIQSGFFKGFQLGNPDHHPTRMCLELFSSDMHVEIAFFQNAKTSTRLTTQADLNRIVQTLTEIPTKESTVTAKLL